MGTTREREWLMSSGWSRTSYTFATVFEGPTDDILSLKSDHNQVYKGFKILIYYHSLDGAIGSGLRVFGKSCYCPDGISVRAARVRIRGLAKYTPSSEDDYGLPGDRKSPSGCVI